MLKKNEPLLKAQGLCESQEYSKSQSPEDKSLKYECITDGAKLRDPGAQWEELYYIYKKNFSAFWQYCGLGTSPPLGKTTCAVF